MEISFNANSRCYLSLRHLSAAGLFAQKSREIEGRAKLGDPVYSGLLREHKASVISSIMLSTAFLEATVNELFADCAEGSKSCLEHLNKKMMGSLWQRGIPTLATPSTRMPNSAAFHRAPVMLNIRHSRLTDNTQRL